MPEVVARIGCIANALQGGRWEVVGTIWGGASILFYTVISLDSDIIQGILKQCDPYVFGFH